MRMKGRHNMAMWTAGLLIFFTEWSRKVSQHVCQFTVASSDTLADSQIEGEGERKHLLRRWFVR